MPVDSWGTPFRDVITNIEFTLETGELNKTFQAFAAADGTPYERPYTQIAGNLDRPIDPNRLETWKKLFDTLGLVYVEAGLMRLSPFGRLLVDRSIQLREHVQRAKDAVAAAAVRVLNRYQLLNPTTRNRDYPPGCDVLPFRFIWTAMRALDNRLHHEELNRVLLRVMRHADLEGAIAKISAARTEAGYDPSDDGAADTLLGARSYAGDPDQATRRMTPWFSLAGFGGLLIATDDSGYRVLNPDYVRLIDSVLASPSGYRDFADDTSAWFDYLATLEIEVEAQGPHDDHLLTEALECCTRFGTSRFILFSGVAGAGKTRMAGLVGRALTNGDPTRYFETQFHESYAYEDFVEGLMPTPAGGFDVTRRIFRLANERAKEVARQDAQAKVVLVIEEFSRANLSNVLGEVFTYIEHRGRRFRYPLSGDEEFVAPNLVVIGTMNPLDRSVVEMDDALIRRTRRVLFAYSETSLKSILVANQLAEPVINRLAEALRDIAPDLPFAHGVFVDVRSEPDLHRLWIEQLEQYFVKPSGQKHPKYDAFRRVFPWIKADFRVAPEIAAGPQ